MQNIYHSPSLNHTVIDVSGKKTLAEIMSEQFIPKNPACSDVQVITIDEITEYHSIDDNGELSKKSIPAKLN